MQLDRRHRLLHPAEDDPARLVALEPDGHVAAAGLERDHVELERRAEHEGRAERRMAGERQLEGRREDADLDVAAVLRRVHEHRLAEPDLERERLHRLVVEARGRR